MKFFDEMKYLLKKTLKKFNIKGYFDESSIITEICYNLGIEQKNNKEIDKKQINNIIIFNIPLNNVENILKTFIQKFDSNIHNDQFPFFIFLRNEENYDFDIKKLLFNLDTFQKDHFNDLKLDSRNIYFETEETIIETIKKIYDYYNDDYINPLDNEQSNNYDITKTLNILVMGKRGSGKSSLINRILGEKKAHAGAIAKTGNTNEFYHKYYPIKLIDSAGFSVGELKEITDIDEYLKQKNLVYKDIYKKVHFIFYVFREQQKLEEEEIKILKKLKDFKVEIIFIITFSQKGKEKINKNNFKDAIKENNIFPKEQVNSVINNTFCLDLFDIQYSKTISDIFILISGKLKEYEELNNILIDSIKNYNQLIKTEEFGYMIEDENQFDNLISFDEDSNVSFSNTPLRKQLNIIHEAPRGLIYNKNINNPNDIFTIINYNIKNNIFFTDFKNDRKAKKRLSQQIVDNFIWPGFWWSSLMIPFLNQYLAKKSKIKMVKEIAKIYGLKLPENYNNEFLNSTKKDDIIIKKVIKAIGTFIAGIWNKDEISRIGKKIIEEFDCEYSKKNVLEIYYNMAEKYNNSFKMISKIL